MFVRRIENCLIPIEPSLDATVGARLIWLLFCNLIQRRCYEMVRVPELLCSFVGNSRQRAPARRFPVCRQHRFPND